MIRFLCVASLALAGVASAQPASWNLVDSARVHPDYRGPVPKKSDVIFSTRFKRAEAPEVIRAFGATRVEWVYSTDKDYIATLKDSRRWFGGALNANVRLPSDAGVARDFDGNVLVAPWMKGWGAKWVTTTHPDTRKTLKDEAARILAAGSDSIQVDDPLLQLHSAQWGGDFNRSTLDGFSRHLAKHPDPTALAAVGLAGLGSSDYREFLRSRYGIRDTRDYVARYRSLPSTGIWLDYLRNSVREHFTDFRAYLNGLRGKPLPLSMNLAGLDKPNEKGWHFFLAEFPDYVMAETAIASVPDLIARTATVRALALGHVPSLMPRTVAENRVAIATLYALGTQPLVPWDVYHGNDEKGQAKRFFGTPEDYAPLYAFVRRNAHLFDNTESTAVVGIPIPVDKFRNEETTRLVRRLTESQVPFAFVLTGGTEWKFRIDPARVRNLRMLIAANPEADFSPHDLTILRSIPIPQANASQLTDDAIRELAPLSVVGGIGAVKTYPRAMFSGGDRKLVIHVVDESRGEKLEADHDCKRRIAIKKTSLLKYKATKVHWYGDGAASLVALSTTEREIAVTIGECRLWGILAIHLH